MGIKVVLWTGCAVALLFTWVLRCFFGFECGSTVIYMGFEQFLWLESGVVLLFAYVLSYSSA